MKNRDKKRLTRAEKIAQAKAIKKGVITDPRHMKGLPVGNYVIGGEAAERMFETRFNRDAARLNTEADNG